MIKQKHVFSRRLLPFAFLSFIGISQSVWSAPCSDQVEALKSALNADGICSYSQVCAGLTHKLDNANHKLEQGEFVQAARRLADFSAVMENMANQKKPKISMVSYESLMDPYFNDAATCIANGGVVATSEPEPEPEPTSLDLIPF